MTYRYFDSAVELARNCDVLILAAAASAATANIVDKNVITALGPDGFLVNVGRGSLVDQPALIAALREGRLAGAGLDVFSDEPHVPPEFFDLTNVALSPHIGSATVSAREAMAKLMMDNLDAFARGEDLPTPVV